MDYLLSSFLSLMGARARTRKDSAAAQHDQLVAASDQ